ncbi:hypothetical protein [Nocardioides massiliensis]|uniref:Uncharacterized protein n=1 Tax=Nocardioides massiliensis TaxID=1325935 RepID=A0ABT9NJ17_9ACTN|nr:hypothetical protein [Nocardioides massiliensis]MDP9820414.1 hypothetical protein [Nocardioides massiliensis]
MTTTDARKRIDERKNAAAGVTAPSMAEVLARWHYEEYDSHFSMPGGLSWEDYKADDPSGAEGLYLAPAQEQAQALADAGFGHVASVEARLAEAERQWHRYILDAERAIARAEAAEARLAAVRALADEWMAHSNEVSKFIDADHAADLRRALDGEATP